MTHTPTFIIADPQPLTALAFETLINSTWPGAVSRRVTSRAILAKTLGSLNRAIVIADYSLLEFPTVNSALNLRARYPNAPWAIISSHLPQQNLMQLSPVSLTNIAYKDEPTEIILQAVANAAHQQLNPSQPNFLSPQALEILNTHETHQPLTQLLTHVEAEILKMIAQGLTAKQIAVARTSSTHTIITHKKNIFRKLGVNTAHEATLLALRAGMVELAEYYI